MSLFTRRQFQKNQIYNSSFEIKISHTRQYKFKNFWAELQDFDLSGK
ncbi:hypothetical protein HMPREF9393_1708 [Streptococcus sanguinis SK1056]|uniref:Uncharacterized protein n=1 Tax=Streptococcus sanguinis SK1056 TaxID=888820 RepID=F3UDV0_STRSA|nr:hypothetical protein HMPREF9393_1708 [Streptococcus sanguinis SK1056]